MLDKEHVAIFIELKDNNDKSWMDANRQCLSRRQTKL